MFCKFIQATNRNLTPSGFKTSNRTNTSLKFIRFYNSLTVYNQVINSIKQSFDIERYGN